MVLKMPNSDYSFYLDSRSNTPLILSKEEYQKAVKEAQAVPGEALWLLDFQEMELQLFRLEKPHGESNEILLSNKKYHEALNRFFVPES